MWRTIALSAICLALVLPPAAGFWASVCAGCQCTEGTPYVIDCSDHDYQTTYSSSDTWPVNKTDIHLLYDKNSLTKVSQVPQFDITLLSYQHNDIDGIVDGAFESLPHLLHLDLSHNKLDRNSLSEHTFRGQYSADDYQPSPLKQLDLSYNNIHSIFEEVFSHFAVLTELNLSHNPLSLLDHHTQMAVTSLPRLRTLRLAGTGLRSLPNGLLHTLITLRHLDLAGNRLTEVPAELHNSHAIQTLTLNNNPIKNVDQESFRGMSQLEVLNLSNMPKLEYIGAGSFSTLVALKILRCRDNKRLWSISSHVFRGLDTSPGIFPLKELFLSGNNLTTLAAGAVPFPGQLLQLQLHDNPWRCDCQLQWMLDSLLPELKRNNEQAAERVVCQSPAELVGVALLQAEQKVGGPLVCPPEPPPPSLGHSGSSATLAAALTIGSLVIFSTTGVVLLLFIRRNRIRQAYSNKLYVTSQLGAVIILLVCVFFFWFVVAADRSGAVPAGDPLLLRLMGSFVVFLAVSVTASLFFVRRQTAEARYRAKQQIRYRRAALEEEAEAEDSAQVVST